MTRKTLLLLSPPPRVEAFPPLFERCDWAPFSSLHTRSFIRHAVFLLLLLLLLLFGSRTNASLVVSKDGHPMGSLKSPCALHEHPTRLRCHRMRRWLLAQWPLPASQVRPVNSLGSRIKTRQNGGLFGTQGALKIRSGRLQCSGAQGRLTSES